MPTSARTPRTSSSQAGRFARPGAGRSSAGRHSAGGGRSATSRPSGRRGGASERRGIASGVIRKRKAKQSGLQKAVGSLTSVVPGLGGKKKSSRSFGGGGKKGSSSIASGKTGKAGGVALLTAAAGVAYSNREKVTSMLRRKGSDQGSTPQVTHDATPATTGTATTSPAVPPHS
jgi:hypothetical protein